jgi:hypothetical protein
MLRRKAWHYRREPRPGVTVIRDRLLGLAFGGRGYSANAGWPEDGSLGVRVNAG